MAASSWRQLWSPSTSRNTVEWKDSFDFLKPALTDSSPIRPLLPILSKHLYQLGTEHSNMGVDGGHSHSNLPKRRVALGPEFEDTVLLSKESVVVRVLDSWTHCLSSEGTERSKHSCSAPSLLIYHRTSAHELVLSTHRLSFSTSVNPTWTLSHRFAQKFVSWVILDPVRLTITR